VQAVAVFKLSRNVGTAVSTCAPTGESTGASAVERRGADRAKNVSRLAVKANARPAQARGVAPGSGGDAAAKTGTDDWESF
jgi:hypothetical protein